LVRAPYPRHRYSFDDYLRVERETERRHEFFDGEIYSMAGGTIAHAALGAEILGQLGSQLRGSPCRVYSSDLRITSKVTGLYTYADATVICGSVNGDPHDPDGNTAMNPTVLVEVTSPSSEERDRNGKLQHYKTIQSLWGVVVVSHRERLVEVHGRQGTGWTMVSVTEGKTEVPGISAVIDVDALYAAIDGL
jgi:Uma2 family endonuclease